MGQAGGDSRLLSPGAFQWKRGTLRGPVKTHLGAGEGVGVCTAGVGRSPGARGDSS